MDSNNLQELISKIKDHGVCIYEYGTHVCMDYYYLKNDDSFYYFDGAKCRRLNYNTSSKGKYINAKDYHTGETVQIYYNKFKRDNEWIWTEKY